MNLVGDCNPGSHSDPHRRMQPGVYVNPVKDCKTGSHMHPINECGTEPHMSLIEMRLRHGLSTHQDASRKAVSTVASESMYVDLSKTSVVIYVPTIDEKAFVSLRPIKDE